MPQSMTPTLLLALFIACLTFPLRAELIAFDDFEGYGVADGTALKGLSSASNGWDGSWGGETGKVFLADMSADPIITVNGFHGGDWAMSSPSRAWTAATRSLETPLNTDDTYYISYLTRITTSGFDTWLYNRAGNRDHYYFGLKNNAASDVVGSVRYGQTDRGGGDLGSSGDYMVVAKISTGNITVWLDPLNESDTPTAKKSHGSDWPNLSEIGIYNNKSSDDVFYDNFMIGTTFRDVVPFISGTVFAME